MKAFLLLGTCTLLLTTLAQGEPQITILDNGLTVITEEMHYAPVVASLISYRVGSRNEQDEQAGISHFCEHLMFKGTPSMPLGRFWQIVQRDGGSANAFTSEDVTVYFLLLPSGRLSDALLIESDRMVNCLIDSAEVVSERNVVHEERRMGIDAPDGALYEVMNSLAFTVHPYGRPVIGSDETILGYDHHKAADYYQSWYNPNNAVLTIVGDFDTHKLLDEIDYWFGDIPAQELPPEPDMVEPPQTSRRYTEIEHESNLGRLMIAFHTPAGSNPDSPVLDLISTYLSSGRASRLDQVLVETGIASSAYSWNSTGIDPGLFVFGVTLMPDVEASEAEGIIWAEIAVLAEEDLTPEVLENLKTRARASDILGDITPLGRAFDLGLSMTMYGNPFQSDDDLETIEATTPGDIRRVTAAYFARGSETVAVLIPTGGHEGMSRDRESLPTDVQEPTAIDYEGLDIPAEMLECPDVSISHNVVRKTLDNGVEIILREDHSFPVVSISFAIPLGIFREDPFLAGLAEVTTEMMMRGSTELSYSEFHDRLESRGSYLRFSASYEYSPGAITLLSEDIGIALRTVADLLMNPAFRQEDFDQVISESLASIERSHENVFAMSMENLNRIVVERSDLAHIPTAETVGAITLSSSFAFFQACSRPSGSCITIVGDIDPDAVLEQIDVLFGSWEDPKSDLPPVVVPVLSVLPGGSIVETMQGRMQAAVSIATPAPGYNCDDYVAFNVMNQILGRGIGSRLGHFVRDDQGLAYAVGSFNNAVGDQGLFIAYLSTRVDYVEQAIQSVLTETMRMSTEEVMEIELDLVKANAVGRHALSSMSYRGQAGYFSSTFMRGQPLDYDIVSLQERLELTRVQLMGIAATYFIDEWFVSIAGGVDEDLNPVME